LAQSVATSEARAALQECGPLKHRLLTGQKLMKRQQNKPHLSTQLAPMIDGESSMLLPSINLFGPSSRVEIPRKLTLDETQFYG
jgi:hypothetical protein